MRKSTELIHAGERVTAAITPSLTTPIYETSTFVFESAAERRRPTRKGARTAISTRATTTPPSWRSEQKLAAVDGAEARAAVQFGHGGDLDDAAGAAASRATRSSAARPSTAARFTCIEDLLARVRHHGRFVSLDELADPATRDRAEARRWCGSNRRSTRRCAASTCATVAAACRRPACCR